MTRRSDHVPAVTAEITPTAIPKKSQMIPAPIASENVAGRPCLIWLTTFVWFEYETSSFENAFCIMSLYWT